MQQGRICPRGASYYTWQPGDTLSGVARGQGTTVQAIEVLNADVDFSVITPGTEICLPSQSYTCITGKAYAVQSGETFATIAQRLGITVYELQERNPGVDANNLTIGQVICIPDADTSLPDAPQSPVQPEAPVQPSQPQQPVVLCRSGYTASAVRRGQTYADLLIENNVSYQAMRTANPQLSPGRLLVGQTYCAPPAGTRQVCSVAARSYAILPGETLDILSERLNVSRGRLLMLNPGLLPSDFTAGTVICIP